MSNTLRYLIRSGDGATLFASAPDLIHHAISLGYRCCDAEDWRAERHHRLAAGFAHPSSTQTHRARSARKRRTP